MVVVSATRLEAVVDAVAVNASGEEFS